MHAKQDIWQRGMLIRSWCMACAETMIDQLVEVTPGAAKPRKSGTKSQCQNSKGFTLPQAVHADKHCRRSGNNEMALQPYNSAHPAMAWHRGHANGPGGGDAGRMSRWSRVRWEERSRFGKRLRRQKGALHGHRVQSLNGHCKFMALCRKFRAIYRCELTPVVRAWIRSRYADVIAAAARPLDESKRSSVLHHSAKNWRHIRAYRHAPRPDPCGE